MCITVNGNSLAICCSPGTDFNLVPEVQPLLHHRLPLNKPDQLIERYAQLALGSIVVAMAY